MVIECPGCSKSYDLSGYKSGQKLRCLCGQILVAPGDAFTVRAARSLHCSDCGGILEKDKPSCTYCGAMIDMTHARLTEYCTSCLSMSGAGAVFCSECGKPLIKKINTPQETDEKCPRCQIKMRRRDVDKRKVTECPMCCGLFVDACDLDSMIRQQEERNLSHVDVAGKKAIRAEIDTAPVTYLKCPCCANMMNRINYGRASGVIIDFCKAHGYWLDAGELEKIAKWVATGGLIEQRSREIEEIKAEKSRVRMNSDSGESAIDGFGDFDHSDRESGLGLFDFLSKLFG
jgi:Zn-finger nucleic acid-binding protein